MLKHTQSRRFASLENTRSTRSVWTAGDLSPLFRRPAIRSVPGRPRQFLPALPFGLIRLWLAAGVVAAVALFNISARAQTNFAVLINDGAYTWYNDSRALFHNGQLYFGYVRAADSKTTLSVFNLQSGLTTNLWASAFTQLDDHNNPGLLAKSDGTLLAIFSRHISDQYFAYRRSSVTNPVSAAGWNAEQTLPLSGAGMTYANPFQLSGESGKIFNFCRNQNFNPTVYTSTDGGASWSAPQLFIQTGTGGTIRPYVKYASDGASRMDFLYTDGHPRDVANSLYHLYYQGGAFYKTDGTLVKNYVSLPILHDSGERGSVIYQYSDADSPSPDQWIPTGRAWCWETAYQTNGAPACVFTVQRDKITGSTQGTDDRIYYYYARWIGTNWQKRFIAQAGRPIYAAENDYAGGICLDPQDVNTIYLSSNAQNPFSLTDTTNVTLSASQRYELWRGTTTNGGLTFAWQPITTNSAVDNLRPYVPRRNGGERCVLWVRGTYTSYTSYACQIVGLFTTRPIAASKISYIDATSGVGGNTTLTNGGVFSPPLNGTPGLDNNWKQRTPLASGGTIFEATGEGNAVGENAPRLITTLTNLIPGATYNLYAYFWSKDPTSTTEQWLLRAGLQNSAGELTLYGTSGSSLMGITSTAATQVTATDNFSMSPTIVSEAGRYLYQASLGSAVADNSGKIPVFIDDYSPATTVNNRTWYDGVGYAVAINPNPTNILSSLNGTNLLLAWPASHLGWILQAQTNDVGTGISANWFDLNGSSAGTNLAVAISQNLSMVLYRLRTP